MKLYDHILTGNQYGMHCRLHRMLLYIMCDEHLSMQTFQTSALPLMARVK